MADPIDSRIYNLRLSVDTDNLTVICGVGTFYLPGTVRVATDTVVTALAVNPTPNSWLHVYGYSVSGNLALELSSTSPDNPYQGSARTKLGDQTRRYLGSMRVGSDGKLLQVLHVNAGATANRIYMYTPSGITSAGATLLTGLTSQTAVTASAAAVVPSTSRLMLCEVDNSAGIQIFFSNPDLGTVSPTSYLRSMRGVTTVGLELLLNSVQQFSYIFGAGVSLGGTASIRCTGYVYDR